MPNPDAKIDVMKWYCGVTFTASALCFGLKYLLLRDSAYTRLSKAAEYVRPVEIVAWVLAWYGISVSMVVANNWLFHPPPHGLDFKFPVLITMVHMWMKFFLSRWIFWCKREKPPHLDMSVTIRMIVPVGIATAGDILLSNKSLQFITMTFYTIVKSGSLMWILLWAAVFKIETLTGATFSVVLCICAGLLLASWGDADFSLEGLLLILGATCLSGVRWALVQLLQSVESSCSDPLLVIYYIAPFSALFMTPISLVDIFDKDLKSVELDANTLTKVLILIVLAGVCSFALVFAEEGLMRTDECGSKLSKLKEVKLLSITSSLTMGVFGTMKELVQIILGGLVFGDKLTWFNILGLVAAMAGSLAYNIARTNRMRQTELPSAGRDGKAGDTQVQNGGGAVGSVKGSGRGQQYSAVSQQEVDEELRVFKYNKSDWELGELEELEEFSSFDVVT